MRKKFHHADKIDLEIMWSDALGLSSRYVWGEIKQNNGIWAPDSGPCEPAEKTAPCQFPSAASGSGWFSWSQREKETCPIVYILSVFMPELYRVNHHLVPQVLLIPNISFLE